MATSPFARKQDRQPYPPTQSEPTPAPAPVPAPVVFPSEHAARSFEARMRQHYLDVTADAAQQSGQAAILGARIEELVAANQEAEEEIRARREAIDNRRRLIDQMARDKAENELMARNNWDDAAGTEAVLKLHGFPVPEPSPATSDVLVASVGPMDPTLTGKSEQCPCGDSMRYDASHGFVHDVPGGWELAGQTCKRLREQTQVMAVTDDQVVAS